MARTVELRTGTYVVENGELNCLVNRKTGGRLQFDLLLPEYKVALEFQGPQHYGSPGCTPARSNCRCSKSTIR